MNHSKFAVISFENRNGVTSWRVDGRLYGVRIRKNFKTCEDAAAEKAVLEIKALQTSAGLRQVATALAEKQVRESRRTPCQGWRAARPLPPVEFPAETRKRVGRRVRQSVRVTERACTQRRDAVTSLTILHRKLSIIFVLVGWLLATGSQWDLVQTIAWTRMFTGNLRTMPVKDALVRTFSPEGRCSLCKAVAAAKHQQDETDHSPPGKAFGKDDLVYLPTVDAVFTALDVVGFLPVEVLLTGVGRSAPPSPPPRV